MRRTMLLTTMVLLLAGCSGDGSGDGASELRSAVERYTKAFGGGGDPDVAWSLVSPRCQQVINAVEYRAAVVAAGRLYPSGLQVTSFEADVEGDTATVTYGVSAGELSQRSQRWTRAGDAWRWDAC